MKSPAMGPWFGVGLAVAGGFKWFASRAGADGLNWILAPTARLASLLCGVGFERELHTGWVSHGERMILGPGCSGTNFMIIAFCSFFFGFAGWFRPSRRWGWLGASMVLSYLLALTTNALRVAVAIHLYRLDVYDHLITPERVHRLAGVVIYCTSLLLAFLVTDRLLRRPEGRSALVPLAWYLAFVIGLPLAGRAPLSQPALFLEHALVVLTVCALLAALAAVLSRGARIGLRSRPGSR